MLYLEIVGTGEKGCISIGLVHYPYPEDSQPGWHDRAIGYHADDGGCVILFSMNYDSFISEQSYSSLLRQYLHKGGSKRPLS